MGDDLAAYLAESEQVNCALALGVSINRDLSVRAAGGYLLQVGTQDLYSLCDCAPASELATGVDMGALQGISSTQAFVGRAHCCTFAGALHAENHTPSYFLASTLLYMSSACCRCCRLLQRRRCSCWSAQSAHQCSSQACPTVSLVHLAHVCRCCRLLRRRCCNCWSAT